MIFITGDKHRDFSEVERFCNRFSTTTEDVMIVLGDATINFLGKERDTYVKQELSKLPITLFCIHGNHEMRPATISTYQEQPFYGGMAYVEEAYPNLIFAKDGEIYDFNGNRCLVIGGAYSVDKRWRLQMGAPWFSDEQPSEEIKKHVEEVLKANHWTVDIVLSHTVPLHYEPIDMFLPGLDQSTVDRSTENWLQWIEENLTYKKWFAGHYHTDRVVDKCQIMYHNIEELRL